MNTRSPHTDTKVPEISQPRFILDRADERGTAVPLVGPANAGTTTQMMGPADPGTVTPLMFPKPVMPRADRKTDRISRAGTPPGCTST